MERTGGVHSILSSAGVYSLFQALVGANRAKEWLASHFWHVKPGLRVVEIGCGPGDVVPYLPADAEYLGYDPSEQYIRRAAQRFARRPRTTFVRGITSDIAGDPRFQAADLVLCNGTLHHLDDREAREVLRFACSILRHGGFFQGSEPCYLAHQTSASRRTMRLDRGDNIRTEGAWKHLMQDIFPHSRTGIATGLIRLPYVHILLEGWNRSESRETEAQPRA